MYLLIVKYETKYEAKHEKTYKNCGGMHLLIIGCKVLSPLAVASQFVQAQTNFGT